MNQQEEILQVALSVVVYSVVKKYIWVSTKEQVNKIPSSKSGESGFSRIMNKATAEP